MLVMDDGSGWANPEECKSGRLTGTNTNTHTQHKQTAAWLADWRIDLPDWLRCGLRVCVCISMTVGAGGEFKFVICRVEKQRRRQCRRPNAITATTLPSTQILESIFATLATLAVVH